MINATGLSLLAHSHFTMADVTETSFFLGDKNPHNARENNIGAVAVTDLRETKPIVAVMRLILRSDGR